MTNHVHPFQETLLGSTPHYHFTGLSVGGDHCNHCGRPIKYLCHISDANGQEYIVGTTCVQKTGDRRIGTPMEIELRRLQKQMREEKKRAKQEAYWNEIMPSGKTRRQERDERFAEMELLRQKSIEERRRIFNEKWGEVMEALAATNGNFAQSVLEGLQNHIEPLGRGKQICCEIFAKYRSRLGESYSDALERMEQKIL